LVRNIPGKDEDEIMNTFEFEIMNRFELRNEEISVKKILAVINATYAVAKRKPEKISLAGIRTLTSAIPVQRSFSFIKHDHDGHGRMDTGLSNKTNTVEPG